MALSKAAILKANDLPREKVTIPEWGGDVFVRTMTGVERDAFEVMTGGDGNSPGNLRNIRARLAVLVMCDENGERLFEEADAAELGKKSGQALDRIFAVAQRLNALADSAVDGIAGN